MDVLEVLSELGGVATRRTLCRIVGRPRVDKALASGEIVRLARGRYALPDVEVARAAAHRLSGYLCLTSAALHWGWAVKQAPALPQVAVGRKRRLAPADRRGVDVSTPRLAPGDTDGIATSRDRTVVDCLRWLPGDEALAIADSALRSEPGKPASMTRDHLIALVRDLRGPGSTQARRIAELADPRAANPFESVLRWHCLAVVGLDVTPQVNLRRSMGDGLSQWMGRPDLVDVRLRIVIEAESFTWHGDKQALIDDAARFNGFQRDGWLVLRFTWHEVMFRPQLVRAVLADVVAEQANRLCPQCRAAS